MSNFPIADYALISDSQSAALVSRGGSVDWLCLPRFDAPSLFGCLLDEEAGHFRVSAVEATRLSRRYLERTMVLETTFESAPRDARRK
jgi:GH15 family glucan-1,4-alpha-glucosidase